jgi:hypothetical protein
MRRLSLLVALAAGAVGCNLVFGIEGGYLADAGADSGADTSDATTDEAADAASEVGSSDAGCPRVVVPAVVALADTWIGADVTCDPATRWGAAELLNVGLLAQASTSAALLRFDVGAAVAARIAAGDATLSLELVFSRQETHPDCGGSCPLQAGTLQAFPLTNDWEEGTTTSYTGAAWCQKRRTSGAVPWQANGASGPSDRGAMAGFLALGVSPPTTLVVPIGNVAALQPWLAGTQLSFVVGAANGLRLVLAARENGAGFAELRASYCP